MTPELHTDADERQPIGQGGPPAEPSPAIPLVPPADAAEARREAPPPAALPPTPPRGGITASVQRMPSGGRWALGVGLAFLSGFVMLFSPFLVGPPIVAAIALGVAFALALAAGFVLTSWVAALALAVATAAGGFVGSWIAVQVSPAGAVEGLTGMSAVFVAFAFFTIIGLAPLIVFLFAGVGLGKRQGMALGQPHALSAGEARVSRWIAAIGPLIATGFIAGITGVAYIQGDVLSILGGVLTASVLAATCLLAGWVLRSWWGFGVAPVVYVGVAALAHQMQGSGVGWPVGFVLYIILPAVVMSAIGTAIGIYTAGHGGQRPQQPQTALPAS